MVSDWLGKENTTYWIKVLILVKQTSEWDEDRESPIVVEEPFNAVVRDTFRIQKNTKHSNTIQFKSSTTDQYHIP